MKLEINFSILILLAYSNLYCQNSSAIFISASTKGVLENGIGIGITLSNIETGIRYTAKPISILTKHSCIKDIPPGYYLVTEIVIPTGSIIYYSRSDSLIEYFDTLSISSNKAYYLGNFFGVRKIGRKNVFFISLSSNEITQKLQKKLKRKKLISEDTNLIKLFPKSEKRLLIY
jgi:hypothetical protein